MAEIHENLCQSKARALFSHKNPLVESLPPKLLLSGGGIQKERRSLVWIHLMSSKSSAREEEETAKQDKTRRDDTRQEQTKTRQNKLRQGKAKAVMMS